MRGESRSCMNLVTLRVRGLKDSRSASAAAPGSACRWPTRMFSRSVRVMTPTTRPASTTGRMRCLVSMIFFWISARSASGPTVAASVVMYSRTGTAPSL